MLTTLRQRRDRDEEEGFTLIELMVVVLIIGILLAIAIPTFLGARNRANDVSAQSNLRNGLTAEKVLYTDNQAYTDSSTTAGQSTLASIEPALTWSAAVSSNSNRTVVATSPSPNSNVVLEDKSATGTCFYISDVTSGADVGTYYMQDTGCTAAATAPATTPTIANASGSNGSWAIAF